MRWRAAADRILIGDPAHVQFRHGQRMRTRQIAAFSALNDIDNMKRLQMDSRNAELALEATEDLMRAELTVRTLLVVPGRSYLPLRRCAVLITHASHPFFSLTLSFIYRR
jgi:hypothetical protein